MSLIVSCKAKNIKEVGVIYARFFTALGGVICFLEFCWFYHDHGRQTQGQAGEVAHQGTHFFSLGFGFRCRGHSFGDVHVPP